MSADYPGVVAFLDYISNLTCPDLRPHFPRLHWRAMPHAFGHLIASDWADKSEADPIFGIYKNCGLWSRDEAAILYHVAKRQGGTFLDVGAHSGWTAAHIAAAGPAVMLVDPLLRLQAASARMQDNLAHCWSQVASVDHLTSDAYFKKLIGLPGLALAGVVIDGDHEAGQPLRDAQNATKVLSSTGVILFHDGVGRPVREAVEWLMAQGFKTRAYFTPHLVFCCWRGDFTPPDHGPDPVVKAAHLDGRYPDFKFGAIL